MVNEILTLDVDSSWFVLHLSKGCQPGDFLLDSLASPRTLFLRALLTPQAVNYLDLAQSPNLLMKLLNWVKACKPYPLGLLKVSDSAPNSGILTLNSWSD